ncbi:MAG: SMC family ATPase, partial [Pyramidobacter sp.]|nr:SMC family ATPase [Pyramidobacter sp.]
TTMIAQGEFLRILNAKSAERKELYQKLFGTERFADFQLRLKETFTACEDERRQIDAGIKTAAAMLEAEKNYERADAIAQYSLEPQYAPVLIREAEALIEYETREQERLQREKRFADNAHLGLVRQHEEAKGINAVFDELNKAESELNALRDRHGDFQQKEQRLILARRAQPLVSQQDALNALLAELMSARQELQGQKASMDALAKQIPALEGANKTASAQSAKAYDVLARARQLEDGALTLSRCRQTEQSLQKAQETLTRKALQSAKAAKAYAEAKQAYFLNQAALLAIELKEGEPCPVCGSREHPVKAQLTAKMVDKVELDAAEEQARIGEKDYQQARSAVEALQQTLKAHESELSSKQISRDKDALTLRSEAEALRKQADEWTAAAKLAETALQSAKVKFASASAACDTLVRRIESIERSAAENAERFDALLKQSGFADAGQMRAQALGTAQIEGLEAEVNLYRHKLTSVEEHILRLREQLRGQQRLDLKELEARLAMAREQLAEKEKSLSEAGQRLSRNEVALKKLRELRQSWDRRQEYWTAVDDVYRTVSGQKKQTAKLTFETYVQQYYFRAVVANANRRLHVLTQGMFTLRVRETASNLVSKTGLDLDVLDSRTGQWRDVSTLSGGESFMASLALALGLSDIAQSQSGAVSIDALFIDEGF